MMLLIWVLVNSILYFPAPNSNNHTFAGRSVVYSVRHRPDPVHANGNGGGIGCGGYKEHHQQVLVHTASNGFSSSTQTGFSESTQFSLAALGGNNTPSAGNGNGGTERCGSAGNGSTRAGSLGTQSITLPGSAESGSTRKAASTVVRVVGGRENSSSLKMKTLSTINIEDKKSDSVPQKSSNSMEANI